MTTIKERVLAVLSDRNWHLLPVVAERSHATEEQVRDCINRENSDARRRFYYFHRQPHGKSEQIRMFSFTGVVTADELRKELNPIIQKIRALKDTYGKKHPMAANVAIELDNLLTRWTTRSTEEHGDQIDLI